MQSSQKEVKFLWSLENVLKVSNAHALDSCAVTFLFSNFDIIITSYHLFLNIFLDAENLPALRAKKQEGIHSVIL